MSNETVVRGSTTPSRKQIALDLTCAIMGNPDITGPMDPTAAADQALVLLNHLEQRLGVAQTKAKPTG